MCPCRSGPALLDALGPSLRFSSLPLRLQPPGSGVVHQHLVLLSSRYASSWQYSSNMGTDLLQASATILVFAYYFIALSHSPALYNRWAVLSLEAVGTFLWLVSLAMLSGWSAHHRGGPPKGYGFWNASFQPSDIGLQSRPPGSKNRKTGKAFAATAAGLSGLEL